MSIATKHSYELINDVPIQNFSVTCQCTNLASFFFLLNFIPAPNANPIKARAKGAISIIWKFVGVF